MDFFKDNNQRVLNALAKVFNASKPDYAEWSEVSDVVDILNALLKEITLIVQF